MKNSFVWDGSYAQALENLVFIHLARRWSRVHFYLTRTARQEGDFIAVDHTGHPALAVRVCLDLSPPETLQRELASIITTARYFGIQEGVIVTYNQADAFHEGGVSVKAIPAWKWLLNQA